MDFSAKAEIDRAEVERLFTALDFESLLEKVPGMEKSSAAAPTDWDDSYSEVTDSNFLEFLGSLVAVDEIYLANFSEQKKAVCLTGDQAWLLSHSLVEKKREELRGAVAEKEVYCSSSKELIHLLGTYDIPLPVALDFELALTVSIQKRAGISRDLPPTGSCPACPCLKKIPGTWRAQCGDATTAPTIFKELQKTICMSYTKR